MVRDKTIVDRAFGLAQHATCPTVADIRKKLKSGGFIGQDIESRLASARLRVQLLHLCRQARKSAPKAAD